MDFSVVRELRDLADDVYIEATDSTSLPDEDVKAQILEFLEDIMENIEEILRYSKPL